MGPRRGLIAVAGRRETARGLTGTKSLLTLTWRGAYSWFVRFESIENRPKGTPGFSPVGGRPSEVISPGDAPPGVTGRGIGAQCPNKASSNDVPRNAKRATIRT